MSKPLRVLALVPYPLGRAPGQRYRIEQWVPYLREEGIETYFQPFASQALASLLYRPGDYLAKAWHMGLAWLDRLQAVLRAPEFDVVYLYREAALVGPALLERLVRYRNSRILFDFDDAIWLPYVSPNNRYLSYLKAPGKARSICNLAAAITVGNETLASFARQYSSAVTVVPSTVSLRQYHAAPDPRTNVTPVIGWTGSHSSAQYLDLVAGALRALARRRRVRLRVIGLEGYQLAGVDVDSRPWCAETEVEDLWGIDIGIMPLSDDSWARGKCAMKAIQYMGVGLPTVVSPVGANSEVVENGKTGFHATTELEWMLALERLIDDPHLRVNMGTLGRRRVEALYSAEVQAPRLADVLRSLRA